MTVFSKPEDETSACNSDTTSVFANGGLAPSVPAPGQQEIEAFCNLLETPRVRKFLEFDQCCIFADSYLIAMVFAYFARARYTAKDYTRENFFIALVLAHDMEEDFDELKCEIFAWNLGRQWQVNYRKMLDQRLELFQRIGYRALVSCKCCHQIMHLMPNHWAWHRRRPPHHAVALKNYAKAKVRHLWLPKGLWAKPQSCVECNQMRAGADKKKKAAKKCLLLTKIEKLSTWLFPDSDEELLAPPPVNKKPKY